MAESSNTRGEMSMSLTTCSRPGRFGYLATKEMAANGDHYESDKFVGGGYDWVVRYYPNNNGGCYISVTLALLTTPKDGDFQVGTRFTCAIQDRQGSASTESRAFTSSVFSKHGEEQGFWTFVAHQALKDSGCIVDDCFTLLCTVSVLKKPQPTPSRVLSY